MRYEKIEELRDEFTSRTKDLEKIYAVVLWTFDHTEVVSLYIDQSNLSIIINGVNDLESHIHEMSLLNIQILDEYFEIEPGCNVVIYTVLLSNGTKYQLNIDEAI